MAKARGIDYTYLFSQTDIHSGTSIGHPLRLGRNLRICTGCLRILKGSLQNFPLGGRASGHSPFRNICHSCLADLEAANETRCDRLTNI